MVEYFFFVFNKVEKLLSTQKKKRTIFCFNIRKEKKIELVDFFLYVLHIEIIIYELHKRQLATNFLN